MAIMCFSPLGKEGGAGCWQQVVLIQHFRMTCILMRQIFPVAYYFLIFFSSHSIMATRRCPNVVKDNYTLCCKYVTSIIANETDVRGAAVKTLRHSPARWSVNINASANPHSVFWPEKNNLHGVASLFRNAMGLDVRVDLVSLLDVFFDDKWMKIWQVEFHPEQSS